MVQGRTSCTRRVDRLVVQLVLGFGTIPCSVLGGLMINLPRFWGGPLFHGPLCVGQSCLYCFFSMTFVFHFCLTFLPFSTTSGLVLQTAKWMAASSCVHFALVILLLLGFLQLHGPAVLLGQSYDHPGGQACWDTILKCK